MFPTTALNENICPGNTTFPSIACATSDILVFLESTLASNFVKKVPNVSGNADVLI